MAHFAKLGIGNIVEEIIVVSNNIATTEQHGINFLRNLYKDQHLPVIQTSYNTHGGVHSLGGTPLRKNYAGIGFHYDQARDAFIAPKPFKSWVLNEETCLWKAPVDMPIEELENNQYYSWNESIINWEIKTKA
jgi:hypothetical protein